MKNLKTIPGLIALTLLLSASSPARAAGPAEMGVTFLNRLFHHPVIRHALESSPAGKIFTRKWIGRVIRTERDFIDLEYALIRARQPNLFRVETQLKAIESEFRTALLAQPGSDAMKILSRTARKHLMESPVAAQIHGAPYVPAVGPRAMPKKIQHNTFVNAEDDANFLRAAVARQVDLRGVSLPGARLEGLSLDNTGQTLTLSLAGADLRFASFRDARLPDAVFRAADLSYADLRGATLRGARFDRADLRHADLRGADLRDVQDLATANLKGAKFDPHTLLPFSVEDALQLGMKRVHLHR